MLSKSASSPTGTYAGLRCTRCEDTRAWPTASRYAGKAHIRRSHHSCADGSRAELRSGAGPHSSLQVNTTSAVVVVHVVHDYVDPGPDHHVDGGRDDGHDGDGDGDTTMIRKKRMTMMLLMTVVVVMTNMNGSLGAWRLQ